MKIDIDKLTEYELIDLNHRIVERLKFMDSMKAHVEMLEFSLGEKVYFSPQGREEVVGVLVKYNKKTVSIVTEHGQKWNVSPHLLKKVSAPTESSKKSGKIIDINPKG